MPRRRLLLLSIFTFVVILPGLFAFRLAQLEWFLSAQITNGVTVKQRPFKYVYDIHTRKGTAVKEVTGWIVRSDYVYGQCRDLSYFMIDPADGHVDRFKNLKEINTILILNRLPIYSMNDEEGIADIKYDGGRNRKYGR